MPSILRKPSRTARLPRNGHDLSRRVLFTSSVGHIIPVLADYLDAGDRVYLNDTLFTRTQPLATPAFVRCREHIYYFFVPMSQIDVYFGQAKYGIRDFHNTNDVNAVAQGGVGQGQGAYFSVPTTRPTITMAQILVAGDTYMFHQTDTEQSSVLNVYTSLFDIFGVPVISNFIRLWDALEFGSGTYTRQTTVGSVRFNPNLFAVYQKIWFDFFRVSSWSPNDPMAYNLNKGLRQSDFSEYITHAWDYSSNPRSVCNGGLFALRYHPRKRDFFTNVEPTPLFSVDGNTGYAYGNTPNEGSQFNSLIASAYGIQLQATPSLLTSERDNLGVRSSSNEVSTMIDGVTTLQGLRLAYAYDRLFSITQRAGKHYDDQVMAHLGVDVPQGVSGESYYLGCHTNNLVIGEVVGTAAGTDGEGSSSVLGELAGRGLGASRKNKRIKFRAPDDGYLMALYCCVPEIEYRDYGINKINLYNSVNDYPRPEFDRLGMQPLYIWQGSGYYGVENAIYGWQYRWSELKLSYDRVHGAFNYTLRNWTSAINPVDLGYTLGAFWNVGLENRFYVPPTYLDGLFALPFGVPFENIAGHDNVKKVSVYDGGIWPGDDGLSSNMGKAWSSSYLYSRDPLLHSIDFDYKKVSWMSTYGLPKI